MKAGDLSFHRLERLGAEDAADEERAGVAEDARHVANELAWGSCAVAGVEVTERCWSPAQRLLRPVCQRGQKVTEEVLLVFSHCTSIAGGCLAA